jgi:hypothetical protein
MTANAGWEQARLGMKATLENERFIFREEAMFLLEAFLGHLPVGALFTADEIHAFWQERGLGEPHHVNVFGAILRKARLRGLLVPTGSFRPSRRTARHGSLIPVYRSGRERRAA